MEIRRKSSYESDVEDDIGLLHDEESLGSSESEGLSDENDSGTEDNNDLRRAGAEYEAALRSTVVDIVSALGGIEEVVTEDGGLEEKYVLGDDCLREYPTYRA